MGLVANGFAENHWGNNLEQRIWAPPPETLQNWMKQNPSIYVCIYIYNINSECSRNKVNEMKHRNISQKTTYYEYKQHTYT